MSEYEMLGRPGAVRGRRTGAVLLLTMIVAAVGLSGCSSDSKPTSNDNPPKQTFSAADFQSSESCQECHPVQYDEWSGSRHAYAFTDPVFFAVRALGQSQYVGALDQACVKCHNAIGSRSGETPWGPIDMASLSPVSREGIGCDLCHTITSISNLGAGGVEFTPGDTKFGTTRDPISNSVHKSEYRELYSSSEYCGACHDLVTDQGLELEATFREWRNGGFVTTGKTCNDCHMPTYQGSMTPGGPVRTLHRHTFPAVDVALVDFPNEDEQLALTIELLRNALTVAADVPATVAAGEELAFQVRITNDKTGHNVPSGVPFNREMWLAIEVRDAGGSIVYASGQLDGNDNLIKDADLFNAQATMLRVDGSPTGATWEAAGLDNPSIKPGETRVVDYVINVPEGTSGSLTVDVTLRFRSFPPQLFRDLNLEDLLPIPVFDMAEETHSVGVN